MVKKPFLSSSYSMKANLHLSALSSSVKLFMPNKNSRISIVPSASPSERNELNVVNDIEKMIYLSKVGSKEEIVSSKVGLKISYGVILLKFDHS